MSRERRKPALNTAFYKDALSTLQLVTTAAKTQIRCRHPSLKPHPHKTHRADDAAVSGPRSRAPAAPRPIRHSTGAPVTRSEADVPVRASAAEPCCRKGSCSSLRRTARSYTPLRTPTSAPQRRLRSCSSPPRLSTYRSASSSWTTPSWRELAPAPEQHHSSWPPPVVVSGPTPLTPSLPAAARRYAQLVAANALKKLLLQSWNHLSVQQRVDFRNYVRRRLPPPGCGLRSSKPRRVCRANAGRPADDSAHTLVILRHAAGTDVSGKPRAGLPGA